MKITICGPDDVNRAKLYEAVKDAAWFARVKVEIEAVDRPLGPLAPPALVIGDDVLSAGTVPEVRQIVTWIVNVLAKA